MTDISLLTGEFSPDWLVPWPSYARDLEPMRIGERQPRCVMFVGVETQGRFTPMGTGVAVSIEHRSLECRFLVVATHVIDQIAGDRFSVRANRKSGGCATVAIMKKGATLHPDRNN